MLENTKSHWLVRYLRFLSALCSCHITWNSSLCWRTSGCCFSNSTSRGLDRALEFLTMLHCCEWHEYFTFMSTKARKSWPSLKKKSCFFGQWVVAQRLTKCSVFNGLPTCSVLSLKNKLLLFRSVLLHTRLAIAGNSSSGSFFVFLPNFRHLC